MEIECKIPVKNLKAIEDRLIALGAVLHMSGLEHNEILDDVQRTLYKERRVLRLRTWPNQFSEGLLTFKAPYAGESAFKTRHEWETEVADPTIMRSILKQLGYTEIIVYEKHRAIWTWEGMTIALDHFSELGDFIEVEGNEEGIKRVLMTLSLDSSHHTNKNYVTLWEEYLREHGETTWRNCLIKQ